MWFKDKRPGRNCEKSKKYDEDCGYGEKKIQKTTFLGVYKMNNFQEIDKIEGRVLMGDIVYKKLKDAIKNGMFSPHMRLIEEKIANMLGTSRTPVREVFQRLEKDGLIYKRSKGGYAVSEGIENNAKEFLELSAGLVGYAVFLATRKMPDNAIKSLEDIIKAEEKFIEAKDYNTFFLNNMKFYIMLGHYSKNTILFKMLNNLSGENFKIKKTNGDLYELIRVRLNLHKKIIFYIKNRDPYGAEKYARRDMTMSMKEYTSCYESPYKTVMKSISNFS